MVSAMGAIRLFWWLKMLRVVSSMKSTSISTKFCSPPGTPAVALLDALRNNQAKISARPMDQPMESTLIDQKPMACASAAECANPQLPSGSWPKVRLVRWCWMYSAEVSPLAMLCQLSVVSGSARLPACRQPLSVSSP